jgi:hypothetical protein
MFWQAFLALVLGVVIGAAVATRLTRSGARPAAQTPPAADAEAALKADVAHLKDIVPSRSHAMEDVGYHMSNLWFAAKAKNWSLAEFEVNEMRARIRWTIRMNPIRKDADGKPVDIKAIFDGIDTSSLAALKDAVAKKDGAAFGPAYRTMLESCYACHKASAKPYLRPAVPGAPPQGILNFDPNATWPE